MELPAHFEALMNRAPIPPSDVTFYLREMKQAQSGPLITSKLLAGKIQGGSEAQALQAFEFLEASLESETEGSIEFRTEIGRYRFLNEIIRILSPKYLGDQTAMTVKDRAIRFLTEAAGTKKQRWFPSEHSKIIMVYQSLVESGIIRKHSDDSLSLGSAEDAAEAELQKSIFDRAENAAALKKLLTSKDPADLQAANRLIKNLVDEEAKRNERRAELHSLIDRIDTTTSLLSEMLNQNQRHTEDIGDLAGAGSDGGSPSMDNKELVDDLADTCRNLRLKLGAVETETGDEATSLLQASENIESALQLYEDRKQLRPRQQQQSRNARSTGAKDIDLLSSDTDHTTSSSGVKARPGTGNGHGSGSGTALALADELLMGISEDFAMVTTPIPPSTNNKDSRAGESLLLNFDVEIKGSKIHQNVGLGDGDKILDVDDDSSNKRLTSFSEIERLSRELLEEGLRDSKAKGHTLHSQQPPPNKSTLSQLQQNNINNSNNNKGSLTSNPNNSNRAVTNSNSIAGAGGIAPTSGLDFINNRSLLQSCSGSGSDTELLDLDYLDKSSTSSKAKPSPSSSSLEVLSSKGQSDAHALVHIDLRSSSSSNRKSCSSVEDDTLLLPLEDEKENQYLNQNRNERQHQPKDHQDREAQVNNSNSNSSGQIQTDSVARAKFQRTESIGIGSFSVNSVKEMDLEEIEFVEDVEPIDLHLMIETDSGLVKCKHVGLSVTFGLFPDFPPNVHVIVITLTNRSSHSVLLNYVFQLLPPKGMQVKLLAPSCMELPPWKKCFLPPPLLTQVAVLLVATPPSQLQAQSKSNSLDCPPNSNVNANNGLSSMSNAPSGSGGKMRFILSYCLGEETSLHNGHFDLPAYLFQQNHPISNSSQLKGQSQS